MCLDFGEFDVRFLLDRAIEMCRRDQLAEIRIALLILREQDKPIMAACPPSAGGRATASIAPTIG